MKREPMWRRYLRFWGPSAERDVDEEFGFHLETKIEELHAQGFSRQEARREALRQFGPVMAPRAECIAVSRTIEQRAWRIEYVRGWWADLRYAVRVLRKAKASTAAAMVILAVGIGAITAVFTILDRMIYEPLPVMTPAQLALVSEWIVGPDGRHNGGETFPVGAYDYLRDRNGSFSGLAAEARLLAREHHGHQRIERPAEASIVSWNYFEVLGVRPIAGRLFAATDDRSSAPRVAIAGYRFAARRYELPREAVGQAVFLRDVPFLIVGVLPPGFYGLQKGSDPDLYVPLASAPELFPDAGFEQGYWLKLFGRLRPEVNLAQSRSNLQVLWEQWLHGGEVQKGSRIECVSGEVGYAGTSDERQRSLKLLGAIVGLLLLIGCANVACLLVARGAARQQETAIRLALGSSVGRIVRQALTENCLLALSGSVAALLVARAAASCCSQRSTGRRALSRSHRTDGFWRFC
jgi:putative ABC transport system permease protein